MLEASLRTAIDAAAIDQALDLFDHLLHRHRRTPHQTVCTQLLELAIERGGSARRALHVLESMAEVRGLTVDDYIRLVRLFITRRFAADALARFEETALDILTFSDDGLHNYFAHISSLLNLELHEQVSRPDGGASEVSRSGSGGGSLDTALVTHKRMLDAAARLCKRAGALTPVFALLLHGMGGREGVQDDAELRVLAEAPTGLATDEQLGAARERLASLEASGDVNASQRAAADAALTRRLTLVQGPPGTGKTTLATRLIALWVQQLGLRPVLACADSNVAVDNLGVALVALGLSVVRTGRAEAVREELHAFMPERLGGAGGGAAMAGVLAAADVVLCTCIGAGAEGSVGRMSFAAVLLDETAQSTEPACLVPLSLGARQVVLVGDHKQLRPTVVSDAAAARGLQVRVRWSP